MRVRSPKNASLFGSLTGRLRLTRHVAARGLLSLSGIPAPIVGAFSLIGIVFVPIGLASLSASQAIVELVDRYDAECVSASDKVGFIQDTKTDKACTRTITVPKPMKGPVHIYYQLENFYQNHRRYVKSRSDKQLRYKDATNLIKTCEPEGTSADGAPIVPCGLIAWSLFNDTYSFSVNKKAIEVNKKNIAWESDKSSKFGSDVYPKISRKGDSLVAASWMRKCQKLYGRIESDIMASDEITVVIQNNYNTYSFGGTKALVLSTTSWIGGKNNFIGVAYVAIGGICFFLALCFVILHVVKPRTLGDPSYLSWNKESPDHPN
ncbi:hypothetical protein PR202_gb01914 [Eleusine coracana subsp. coracana]|uniref:ALA-interacting subunit n=1 Tax=Eleusine coracana subsp. coracana TaxID=191504 RepID=A0AAV5DVD3_ELECO|nr:hypothetical protein PR202_gb01914 [Eleusine coracana subsp. coracana]